MPAVKVTLITGYLGAGKTTLLLRIAAGCGMRIAIVMNEFGQIPVDGKILEGKDIRMLELTGGCVCCSLSGEFSAAVAELLETAKPEWIVVETTGAAEPSALAYDIQENMPGLRLDAIVTVVDADAMVRFPNLGHTGKEQIELADILILNKTDLVGEDGRSKAMERIRGMNPRAAIMESERCDIDVGVIFGIRRNAAAAKHKTHNIAFECFDYAADGALDHDTFLAFLDGLPREIYRSKGFVRTDRGSYLMNHVAGRHTLEDFAAGRTELVFIGEGALAHRDRIVRALESMRK
ncbi:GTP-binding protein [Candidatus Micrarchaeota archaeon]|nr:GTP-binding protein [Candidatus Micrarchaeota archaeon]